MRSTASLSFLLLDDCGHQVGGAEKAGHERVGRALVQVGRGSDLLHLAVGQDRDLVGHGQRLVPVVGDEHGGGPGPPLQAADLVPHGDAEYGVEIGQRLIEQEQLRLDDQGPGKRHPLLLAAR